jgi:hypothetical protein
VFYTRDFSFWPVLLIFNFVICIFDSEAAARVEEIFSGYQQCRLFKNDPLFPHHQDLQIMMRATVVTETSEIFNYLTLLIGLEDII